MNSNRPRNLEDASRPQAFLRFLAGWRETQEGEIRSGGTLVIEYDPERLSNCHTKWRGADIWSITAHIRFHPCARLYEEAVLEPVIEGGMTVAHRLKPVQITVPGDTRQLELWFHTSYQLSSSCEAWDSRFGQNYWFTVSSAEGVAE